MSDETTLLPCAHCGGKGKLVFYYDFYHVSCTNDDCVEHYDEGMIYRGEGAWYGSVADACDAWNTRATHGTLTAEQVRETVEKHWHDLPDEYDMPEATALPEYSYDWQAITDELNAERGSGTCEMHEDIGATQTLLTCSECGYTTRDHNLTFCGGCGARIRKAVD